MIGYIEGEIISLTEDEAIIKTSGGVGFEIAISGSAYEALLNKTEGGLYTYLQQGDMGSFLYGFSTAEEKEMFLRLISVSGVGPKAGIAILSSMSTGDIASAIAGGDIARLSSVKGLGKKTAERIVVDLREKMGDFNPSAVASPMPPTRDSDDAVTALMSMGYTKAESERAITRARESGASTLDEMILTALKGM